MAFTRDWLEVNPIDHTKFKEAPGTVRATKVDVSDRLKDILSGFVSGETAWGIKLGKYLTQGTAAPSAPSGTGVAQDMNFYIRTIGTGTYADAYIRGTSGPEVRMTIFGRLCLNNARMSNDTYILGTDTNGAAQNILKLNTANAVEFASHIFVPDTNPASALVLAPKGYIDALGGTYKIGTISRDMTAASGDVSTTGVGFKPKAIIFMGSSAGGGLIGTYFGMSDGTLNYCLANVSFAAAGSAIANNAQCIEFAESGTKIQGAIVKTFDADGFTLTWTKTGTTAAGTMVIFYLAFR